MGSMRSIAALLSRTSLPRVSAAAVALLAISACKSSLHIDVERYQGELILAEKGRELRAESMVFATQQALHAYWREGKCILDAASAARELKPHEATLQLALLLMCGRVVGVNPLAPDAQWDEPITDVLTTSIGTRSSAEPQAQALARLATAQPGPAYTSAVKQAQLLNATRDDPSKKIDKLVKDQWKDQPWLKAKPAWRAGAKPNSELLYTQALAFAEHLNAITRTIESVDEKLRGILRAKLDSKGTGPAVVAPDSSGDEGAVIDLLVRIWLTMEESYPRLAGLSNFGLSSSASPAELANVRTQLRNAQAGLMAGVADKISAVFPQSAASQPSNPQSDPIQGELPAAPAGDTDDEPPASQPAPKEPGSKQAPDEQEVSVQALTAYFDAVKYAQNQLSELENPYVPVHSAGAYLGLEEMRQAIQAQQRPGYDIGRDWQSITQVEVEAGANANYVVMRDHVGNWQVKAARNDPTELINAAYGGALAVIELATQTGQVSQNLREAYAKFAADQKAGIATPIAMHELVALLEKRNGDDLKPLDKQIAAAQENVDKAAAALKALKPDDLGVAQAQKDLDTAQAELAAILKKKLALQEAYARDLELVEQALEGVQVPDPKQKSQPSTPAATPPPVAAPAGGG